VTDIIRDIDEEMRRDAFMSRVRRYAWVFFLVVFIVLVVVAVGYFWQGRQASIKTAKAAELSDALTLVETDEAAAKAQLQALASDGSNGNSILAGFELAELGLRAGNSEEAVAAFETLAAARDGDAYAKAATLFGIYSSIDTADVSTLLSKLDPLIAENGAFTALATELKAQVLVRDGKADEAIGLLDGLLEGEGLERDLHNRAQALRDSLGAGS